jgi:hypothetical protein
MTQAGVLLRPSSLAINTGADWIKPQPLFSGLLNRRVTG